MSSGSAALLRMVRCRLVESLRHPETIFWTFVFPGLLAAALGIAFRADRPAPAAAVVARAQGAADIEKALTADNTLRVEVLARDEAERALRSGRAAVMVVPGNPVLYRFDPTRPESRLSRDAVDTALQKAAGRADAVAARDDPVSQRGSRYIDFLVPGLLGMNLMAGGLWGIGWVIVEARIRKLLKLQVATPMRRRDYLLSHVLTRLAYIPLEAVPLLTLAWLLFGVTNAGSYAALAVVVVLGALCFAGLGTLVASRATTTVTISGLINLCTLPMFVVSGVFFSTSRFPDVVQPLIGALPLTALNDALRAIMEEGAALPALWRQLLVLVGWAAASFAAAVKLFRWT